MKSMQPTIIADSEVSGTIQDSLDVSRANVGFIAGDQPHFSDETAALLRSRLSAASMLMTIVLGAAFVGNLINGTFTLWWLRALILVVIAGSAAFLKSRPLSSLRDIQKLELIIFGSVVVQLSAMLLMRISEFAASEDAASIAVIRQAFLMAWCILIFVYGTFMPNTWRRGALVMIPAAVVPYVILFVQGWLRPEIDELHQASKVNSPLPMPIVAAFISTFAAHVINSARREAFKARQFGQYRLMEKLGAGGMGEVYKAEHVLLKRPCAIKLIRASNEADIHAIARFEKEVKATAKLTHWNTVEIYDFGRTEDGTFYYVMELLPGMSLEDLVENFGPMPPQRVLHLLRQICGALEEAHAVGLIHRDIKPANIFVSQRGGVYDVAKLLDFGLVKESSEKSESMSKYGSFSGTPLYMSPEQASAYDDVDGRADLYSLGAVAWYMLVGKPPFESRNVLELLAAHRNTLVTPPSQLIPGLPDVLDQIVLKCMAKAPSDRYSDAASLRRAIESCSLTAAWTSELAADWWNQMKSGNRFS
ncbi:MAG: protein kinase [Planctomyces sp.]|nr:protein kinase [Planctomyces sp.]